MIDNHTDRNRVTRSQEAEGSPAFVGLESTRGKNGGVSAPRLLAVRLRPSVVGSEFADRLLGLTCEGLSCATRQRSEIMRRVRNKDTTPELYVRRLLHARGFRFRLHRRDLPGSPDVVLPAARTVIFVHGCFWHGHDCRRGQPPASNQGFWMPKLEANRRRDRAAVDALEARGWHVEIVWQCSLKKSTEALVGRLEATREAQRTIEETR